MAQGSSPTTISNDAATFTDISDSEMLEHSASLHDAQTTRLTSGLHSYEDLLSEYGTMADIPTQLRRQLNTLVPVAKLPSELLCCIFEAFTKLSENRATFTPHPIQQTAVTIPIAPLVSLTHVCHYWRSVALNTPAFWTRVDFQRPAELREMYLHRAQSIPLSLVVDITRLSWVVESYGARLRRLDILLPESTALSAHRFHATCNFLPLLECLTVNAEGDPWPNDGILEADQVPAPGQPVSHLKALFLRYRHPWRPVNSFINLTHLYLDWWTRAKEGWSPNVDCCHYLSDCLSHTPALQYLHLVHLGDQVEGAEAHHISPPPSPVPLRSIRMVTCVISDMATAIHLLSFLELPETALVRLTNLERVLPLQADFLPPTASPRLAASFSRAQILMDLEFLTFCAEGPQSGLWIDGGMYVFYESDPDWTPFISWLGRLDLLSSLRSLHVGVGDDPAAIPTLLRYTHSLESLTVTLRESGLIESRTITREAYAALSDPARCPQLRSLVLLCRPSDPEQLCPTELVDMLEARGRGARPLGRLTVKHWQTTPRDPAQAREERDLWDRALEALFPLAKEYVDVVDVADGEDIQPFASRHAWRDDGAEEYWDIPPEYQRRYCSPSYYWPTAEDETATE